MIDGKELLEMPEGTKVIASSLTHGNFAEGDILTRKYQDGDDNFSCWFDCNGRGEFMMPHEVNYLVMPTSVVPRPVLEERKAGKVLVHLVDQGFPTALYEVAKVMTWAAENKGYKPHDWKRLPDAENVLEGAASRHRMMHNMQRQNAGYASEYCVDEESKLLHKAHEAFNVLAELELMLTGKIA